MENSGIASTRRFLLEIWLEPREIAVKYLFLRGRIRDLSSGQSRAVKSIAEVSTFIDATFDEADAPPRRWEGDT